MMAPEQAAAILLAAGRGSRFGANKLLWEVNGCPLGAYAAWPLMRFPVRIAVTAPGGIGYASQGFIPAVNREAASGIASSIRAGVREARRHGVLAVVIALGDMPFVPARHYEALLDQYRGPESRAVSAAGHRTPPALFGAAWFDRLETLQGDRGAGALLSEADPVPCEARWLADIDRREDLALFTPAPSPRHSGGEK